MLVFREQSLDDARQIEFSQRFGPLETVGQGQSGDRDAVRAAVEPRYRDRRGHPAGGPPDDLPEGQLPLALGQFVPGSAVAVFFVVGAHRAAGGRQYRIRLDARGL